MHALDKKLTRDFRRLWMQALAIALVLACGVAILLTAFGMYRALDETRRAYYERNRFADVFVQARRVPESLLPELRAIPGVQMLEPGIVGNAILDLPDRVATAVGHIIALPANNVHQLNVPLLQSGRYPEPSSNFDVLVNEPFARAHGYLPGDTISINLNGQKRALRITGTVQSPEFIYTIGPGALMPDNAGYGIIWMPRPTTAAAFDMTGAFNNLAIKLASGVRPETVIDAIDNLLEPYGGLGAYDRSRQQSDAFVSAEINQLRGMAVVLPPIFFAISAFLVSMVMGRVVALERSEIGLLKALGYSNFEVCLHYLMLAGLVAVTGIVIGWVAGGWLARNLARQYAEFFEFPFLIFSVSPWIYALAGLAALLTTILGATRSALTAAWLAPAIAMQPPAPPSFKRSVIDVAMDSARLSQPTIMILRSFVRWPVRSLMTSLGLAMAVASVVASAFFNDALDAIIESAFYESNRQDAMLLFAQDVPLGALQDVRRLPGVLQVEGQQYHSAILRHGARQKTVAIEARFPDPDLSRVIGADGAVVNVPPGGIVLSERLASQLDVTIGDALDAEFLTGKRETLSLTVSQIVEQYFGLGAYVDLEYVNTLFRQVPQVSVVNVALDETRTDDLHEVLKGIPKLASLVMLSDTRRSFDETIEENIVIMNTIYITIAVLITVGVAYNGARIQLSERARELASLRILGFTRAEVSYILIGETLLLAILAQPLGWLIGAGIAKAMADGFTSDLYSIPLVLKPATFASASLVVLTATVASVLIVRRRLDRLNLVAVMKTRE